MDVSTGGVARELGAQLAQLRTDAGLTLRQLEQRVPFGNAKISLIENGRRLPSHGDLELLLTALNATDDVRERLTGLRREADTGPGEITSGAPSIGPHLAQLIDYEERALRIFNWAPLLVPGLLQIEGYTRAIMGDDRDADTKVTLRAGRQRILTRRRNAVELVAVVDSEVLARPVAPVDVMIDQLHFLLDMAERPNITLQVLSSTRPGYHGGLSGPFQLIEFPTARPIVHIEHHSSALTLWQEGDVKSFVRASEMIQKAAMTPAESAGVIRDIVNGMETT
jgi:transcriptional regulator with XRE-family HTH domain